MAALSGAVRSGRARGVAICSSVHVCDYTGFDFDFKVRIEHSEEKSGMGAVT